MSTERRVQDLVERGEIADAFALLSKRANKRDPAAAELLAQWRMEGQLIRRDLGDARRLFGIAANAGSRFAQDAYIAFLANGAGGTERHWGEAIRRLQARTDKSARAQLAVLDRMDLDGAGDPASRPLSDAISQSPAIARFRDFLSPEECAYLAALAEPLLQPSVVIHPQTGQFIRDPVRRSSAAGFPIIAENPVLHAINRRISVATATRYEQGEPLQVLSYQRGEEYRPHSDALPHEPNQRILTFLVYLNADYDGGETAFPNADIAVRGTRGDGLLFANVDGAGRPDPRAVHAGQPVTRGRKLVLSKWIRRQPLDLTGPPGRPF